MQDLDNLEKLDLKLMDSNGFQGWDNLEELDLRGNKLTKIESKSFQHLNKLKI